MKKIIKMFSLIAAFFISGMLIMALGASAQSIRLIVRGDDMGMTQGSLVAFEKAFNEGVLTAGGIIVPAPWFEGAADLCRKNPRWCAGVHLALVGEWMGYRWRPVLPWDKVSTLVTQDGFLFTHPDSLFARKPSLKEIDAELRAQVELAKKEGINVQYIDYHYMSNSSYPGLENIINSIAKDYSLPISQEMGENRIGGVFTTPVPQKKEVALEQLEALKPGLWFWVCHIGIESPEQNALVYSDPKDRLTYGSVGAHRAAELAVLLDPDVKALIKKKGIVLTSYTDLAQEKK
jgi:chitin disaccharide deacetylase